MSESAANRDNSVISTIIASKPLSPKFMDFRDKASRVKRYLNAFVNNIDKTRADAFPVA